MCVRWEYACQHNAALRIWADDEAALTSGPESRIDVIVRRYLGIVFGWWELLMGKSVYDVKNARGIVWCASWCSW